jgi:hypothetical protein
VIAARLGAAAEGGLLAESRLAAERHARIVALHTIALAQVRHARELALWRVYVDESAAAVEGWRRIGRELYECACTLGDSEPILTARQRGTEGEASRAAIAAACVFDRWAAARREVG